MRKTACVGEGMEYVWPRRNDKPWFFTTEPLLEDRFLNFSFGFLIISITYTTAYISKYLQNHMVITHRIKNIYITKSQALVE